jgi:hypothetical protein
MREDWKSIHVARPEGPVQSGENIAAEKKFGE